MDAYGYASIDKGLILQKVTAQPEGVQHGKSQRRLIAAEPRQLCCSCLPKIDGSAHHSAKPVSRLADHLPALRRHSTDNWRA